jgi:D-tyrosyl-tRNA(Tyr) deacylase
VIGLLQRVNEARVDVEGETVGAIGAGLMVLIGVQRNDTQREANRLLDRLLSYRVFEDDTGRMNRSVTDINGELLLVPQFTLPADTRKGTRPSFTPAAAPDIATSLFDYLVGRACAQQLAVQTGRFGAYMQVSLINDGPVTFWLEVTPQ